MKRMLKYDSIEQFNTVKKQVKTIARHQNIDSLPVVTVTATEKIHGTNAAVCFSNPDGFWVQSRKNIITVEADNAGCAKFVYGDPENNIPSTKDDWMEIIEDLAMEYNINLDTHIISVYFEWAGGNIQPKSALSGMDKRAVIFQHFKVSPIEPEFDKSGKEIGAVWYPTSVWDTDNEMTLWVDDSTYDFDSSASNIFNIMNYETWSMKLDFNNLAEVNNAMLKLVLEVIEPNSPIGRKMGIDGNVGEGAVFTFELFGELLKFKVKGDKHSKSKVKTLKPVDEEKENLKISFVNDYACKAWRLEQMFAEVFDTINGGVASRERTGDFLRAVKDDVRKEELENLAQLNLEFKEVAGLIDRVAVEWFKSQLDNEAFSA